MKTGIKRILQEDATGCGLACIAMIVGKTYAEVKKIALDNEILEEKRTFYTKDKHLISLLDYFNFKAKKERKVSQWPLVQTLSIVAINYKKNNDSWHWVVYVPDENQGYVLDPHKKIKTDKRVDFSRMRVRSYIPIESI